MLNFTNQQWYKYIQVYSLIINHGNWVNWVLSFFVVFGYLAASIHWKDLQVAFAAFAKAYYLRDAYTGWVLLRMVPSRLLRSFKKPLRLPSRNFSACIILAAVAWTFDSFPVRSWRSRSRGREKLRIWDCICQSSGKAPNQQNCMG